MIGVHAYPVAGKQKSYEICEAFAIGHSGKVLDRATTLQDGPAFFFGVDASNEHLWNMAKARGDFYYCDNSFFDSCRQQYFRISKDRIQHSGIGDSDGKRWKALGIRIRPWRENGRHIVVCPQSSHFMRVVCGLRGMWADDWPGMTVKQLSGLTTRNIRVRDWSPNKGILASTLQFDLQGSWALVTWSSAAAITAILEGIPAITMGQCAAEPMAGRFTDIENPPTPDGRELWASVLADNQFTLDEMRSGYAWEALQ